MDILFVLEILRVISLLSTLWAVFTNGYVSVNPGTKLAIYEDLLDIMEMSLEIQMRATKTAAYYISPIEMGVIWGTITYVKSHSKALGFRLQTDMNQIFQMRYYKTLNDNLKQNYRLSNFAVKND